MLARLRAGRRRSAWGVHCRLSRLHMALDQIYFKKVSTTCRNEEKTTAKNFGGDAFRFCVVVSMLLCSLVAWVVGS